MGATFLLKMADLFCNSVGILQQSTVEGASKNESRQGGDGGGDGGGGEGSSEPAPGEVPPEENIKLFSTLITRTAQDIDTLIDSLPSSEYTAEMQVCSLASACVECVCARACVCVCTVCSLHVTCVHMYVCVAYNMWTCVSLVAPTHVPRAVITCSRCRLLTCASWTRQIGS